MRALQGLPPEPLKFVLNVSLNTLPTNACYGARQTLLHVLNNCSVAMGLRRYNQHHDVVPEVFGSFIRSHLPSHYSFSIDSPSGTYIFPYHITPTNLRPDVVWWSNLYKELWLFELTISHESLVAGARGRKRLKHYDLVEAGRTSGYRSHLITLEVGSWGMLGESDLAALREAIDAPRKAFTDLCLQVIRNTIPGLFRI